MCRALNCSQQSRSATLHEPGLPGGPRRINQNFDIEVLEPSISVYDLTFDIEDSSILIYDLTFELCECTTYRRIFDIEYYQYRRKSFDIEESSITKNLLYRVLRYRSTDLRYRSFFISVCFDIEECRLRYRSTDLRYRSYISYPISKLNH